MAYLLITTYSCNDASEWHHTSMIAYLLTHCWLDYFFNCLSRLKPVFSAKTEENSEARNYLLLEGNPRWLDTTYHPPAPSQPPSQSGLTWRRFSFLRRHLGRRVTAVTRLRWPTVMRAKAFLYHWDLPLTSSGSPPQTWFVWGNRVPLKEVSN